LYFTFLEKSKKNSFPFFSVALKEKTKSADANEHIYLQAMLNIFIVCQAKPEK